MTADLHEALYDRDPVDGEPSLDPPTMRIAQAVRPGALQGAFLDDRGLGLKREWMRDQLTLLAGCQVDLIMKEF